ncbi:hypothetical protein SAMN02910327_01150 [Peptostreptococcaceae bacterium pGA-8]|nr:hypothetical protein SAMN02910327_01150 [Peptostreptococcaceae bacterium pGA-8]
MVSGGKVSVKYIIEGTEVTLENPAISEVDSNGNYVVKKENTEIGTPYDTTTMIFQPKRLMKDGKTYELTARKVAPKTDPITGEVKAEDQLIIYEYRLVEEPEAPTPGQPKKPNVSGPKTGDASDIQAHGLLVLMSGILIFAMRLKKRREEG